MNRGVRMALFVSGVVLVSLVVLVVLFRRPPPEVVQVSTAPVPDTVHNVTPPSADNPPATARSTVPASMVTSPSTDMEEEREYEDVATAEDGLRSMGASLSRGDARTPALSEDVQRERPTPDVLNDPAAYEAFEQKQSRSIAAGYLSIINQVPAMQARIEEAKISGRMSPEEIAEAEEAVQKILELEREMSARDPELVNEVRNAGSAPAPDQ
jgi:hypothetical protein